MHRNVKTLRNKAYHFYLKQDKYTLDPGYKNLSKNYNKFSESYILV